MVGRHVGIHVDDGNRTTGPTTSTGGGWHEVSTGRFSRRRFLAAVTAGAGIAFGGVQLWELRSGRRHDVATAIDPSSPRLRTPIADRSVVDGRLADAEGGVVPTPRPGVVSPAPWTQYHGAVRDAPIWAGAQRGGWFFADDGSLDGEALATQLQTHDVAMGPAFRPPLGDLTGVRTFMDQVQSTGGAWWRDISYRWVHDLIEVHRHTPHKVIAVGTENEVNHPGFQRLLRQWALEQGLPFPHPDTAYGDAAHVDARDHLGYYVEYFLAPAVEGAMLANAEVAAAERIPIQLGTVVGIWDAILDTFLPALLDYEIEGIFAPSLAGRRVADVVDHIGIHYLLTAERIGGYLQPDGAPLPYGYHGALRALDERWRGNGSIKGIWLTEEGGNITQQRDQHASLALRVFARSMSWVTQHGVTPDEFRVFGYYQGPPDGWGSSYRPRWETSWDFGLTVLHEFLGHDARIVDRSDGVDVAADDPVEAYGFETHDGQRRVLIVTPQSVSWQGRTTVTAIRTAYDGWAGSSPASAVVHLFKSDAEAYRTFEVDAVAADDSGCFELTLPQPIALNANGDLETIMVELTR